MFLSYYVQVDHPFEVVEPAVLRMLPGLRGWADDAYREGERIRARIGMKGVAKAVEMTVGEPSRGAAQTWIPLDWQASGAALLFPRMQADLVVAAVGPALTQVAFRGTYRVPLGKIGAAADRALLHRVAESTVKGLVDAIGSAAEREAAGVPAQGSGR